MKIFPALFCFCMWSAHADDITIARLFFTPAERAALDKARQEKPSPRPPASEEAPAPVESPLSVNGIVRRTDGKSTVWVNAKPIQEGDPQVKIGPANSTIIKRSNGQEVAIEPGQFFDPASSKVTAPVSISRASKPSH